MSNETHEQFTPAFDKEAATRKIMELLDESDLGRVADLLTKEVAELAIRILCLPNKYKQLLSVVAGIKIDAADAETARENAELRRRVMELESVKAHVACELDIDNSEDLRVFQIDVNIAVNIMSGATHE